MSIKRSDVAPEKDYMARCQRDFAEARARGWTSLDYATVCEPPVPMGYPPADHPKRHDADTAFPEYGPSAVRLPDYGDGEDGGYLHTPKP